MNIPFTRKLIEQVRNRPVLYLISHPGYKNAAKKMEAWREIAEELGEEVVTLKAKWKNLKDTYRKHVQCRLNNTGVRPAKNLELWMWADEMSFVELSPASWEGPLPRVSAVDIEYLDCSDFGRDIVIKQEPVDPCTTVSAQMARRRHKIRRRRSHDEAAVARCDGVDQLFLGYAHAFKKLSRRRQVQVKFAIAQTLMEAELGDLDGAPCGTCFVPRHDTSNADDANA